MIYDIRTDNLRKLTSPAGRMDILPEFYGNKIRFMRGSTFEFSFAGSEHEVSIDGKTVVVVPGGKVIKGEDLSGGD